MSLRVVPPNHRPRTQAGGERVLIVPGLHGSGPAHWQTWLQAHYPSALRIALDDWSRPDLARWSAAIGAALATDPHARWIGVAHSFGCLALAQHIVTQHSSLAHEGRPAERCAAIAAALLVAPADPARFRLGAERMLAPPLRLGVPSVLLASDDDPWMARALAAHWAQCWGAEFTSLGLAGHVNVDAGFGPLPRAKELTEHLIARVREARRIDHASILDFSFAV